MEYNSLLSAIPWKRILSADTNASKPIETVFYENLIHDNKSCKKVITLLLTKHTQVYQQAKDHGQLNSQT